MKDQIMYAAIARLKVDENINDIESMEIELSETKRKVSTKKEQLEFWSTANAGRQQKKVV